MSNKKSKRTKAPADAITSKGNRHPISERHARAMFDGWAMCLFDGDDGDMGQFLYLLRALVYEDDATAREEILNVAEAALMPYSVRAGAAIDAVVAESREGWTGQKGGV